MPFAYIRHMMPCAILRGICKNRPANVFVYSMDIVEDFNYTTWCYLSEDTWEQIFLILLLGILNV